MKLINKNILVTGGAGFIGSHLCEEIAKAKPKKLVVIDNLFLGKLSNLKDAEKIFPKLKFYKASICNISKLKRIIIDNHIDSVFNLAVLPLPASLVLPEKTFKENVLGVLNLCELARKKYFQTLIHCSSSETYGSAQYVPMGESHPYVPSTPYAASKVAGDQICLSYAKVYGIDLSIVRPFNNYGPRQNEGQYAGIIPIVIKNALNNKAIQIFGDGEQTRDFIFVKDTVRAIINIYENTKSRGKVINIASGKEININRLVKLILSIMGETNAVVRHTAARPADVRRHCADITLAKKTIGFQPEVDLVDGLKETVNWYISNEKTRRKI